MSKVSQVNQMNQGTVSLAETDTVDESVNQMNHEPVCLAGTDTVDGLVDQ